MPTNFNYCPILKGKSNDIKAFGYLSPAISASVKPLYELPPFKPTDEPEKILSKFTVRLNKFCGSHAVYVDYPLLKPGAKVSSGESALSVAYSQLGLLGVNFEPVFGFDRDNSLWNVVIDQSQRSGGMLLRLDRDDLELEQDTIDRISDLRSRGLDIRQLDILIDWRALTPNTDILKASSITADFIDKLSSVLTVRKILVAGSSAPKTVTDIERDSYGVIPRHELSLWAGIASERLSVPVIYSDYGVIHPDFSDLTQSTHINGKIRYTEGANFHIHRGHSLRLGNKFEQYRALSLAVTRSGHYQGNSFSYGDRYIYECATGSAGTGNPGTWVFVDQNHHITYTSLQLHRLANLAASGHSASNILEQA